MSASPLDSDAQMRSWLTEQFKPGLVSIIIPAYNRERWIGEALDSVCAQTWSQLEFIVVDDGSSDGTAKIVEDRCRTDDRLKIITQENAGIGAARNAGTLAAQGEFIVYLDSDDILFPEAIQNYVECLLAYEANYCFAPIDSVDDRGQLANDARRFHPKVHSPNFLMGCFWLANAACYRREVINAAGPWNTTMPVAEDSEFLWRVKTVAGQGHYLNQVTGAYRQHSRDQLHHCIDQSEFYKWKLKGLGFFVEWLKRTGRWNREICHVVAKEYRFIAVRVALLGDMKAKNCALTAMQQLCHEYRHPMALFGALRLINVKWFYQLASQIRYQRHQRKQQGINQTIPAKKTPSLLFVSPLFPDAEGTVLARRAENTIRTLSQNFQVTLLVVSSAAHAASKPVYADYLGGRWGHVPFEESGGWRFQRKLEQRLPLLYRLCGKLPTDLWHAPKRCTKARMIFDGQQFAVVRVFGLAVADCALRLRKTQPEGTKFHLDIDDIELIAGESRAHAHARAKQKLFPCFDRLYVSTEKDRARLSVDYSDVRLQSND